jgi:hypothetical protein
MTTKMQKATADPLRDDNRNAKATADPLRDDNKDVTAKATADFLRG